MAATNGPVTTAQPVAGVSYADALAHSYDDLDSPPLTQDAHEHDDTKQPIQGVSYADAVSHPEGTYEEPPATNGVKHDHPTTPGEYTGAGMDDAPRSPMKGHKKVASRSSRSSLRSSPKQQKKKEGSDGEEIVYEKLGSMNGSQLTSVKPTGFEEGMKLDEQEKKRRKSTEMELVSGREPSSGWERSGIRFCTIERPLEKTAPKHSWFCYILCHSPFSSVTSSSPPPFLSSGPFYFHMSSLSCSPTLAQTGPSHNALNGSAARNSGPSSHPTSQPVSIAPPNLPPTRKYIFGYHPHGIISHGAFAAFATEALGFSQLFPGITNTLLTLDSNFRVPFYRDYLLRMGLASVSRESCTNLLTRGGPNGEGMGRAITIVIGGARESLLTSPGTLRLVLPLPPRLHQARHLHGSRRRARAVLRRK